MEGTVLVDGQPMEGVVVVFYPDNEGNRAASGRTDAEGRFVLMTLEQNDGAMPGNYKVSISKYEGEERNPNLPTEVDPDDEASLDAIYNMVDTSAQSTSTNLIADMYANHLGSGLTAEVKAGEENDFTFDVEGSGN